MKGKKILITGFSGFVAWHFVEFLYKEKIYAHIYGIDINEPKYDIKEYELFSTIEFKKVDMTDKLQLEEVINAFVPDYILHLASYSSVAFSWKYPADSFLNNSIIFLNLLESINKVNRKCRILSIGSSEEYGNVEKIELPIIENQKLNPTSPYAVARVAQELLSKVYVESFGLDIVLTRSFNHIGPRQDERFVVPSFIKRILEIKRSGNVSGVIETGDLSIIRDFLDVRDVVRAYYILLMKGKCGVIYNVCSGKGVRLEHLINIISEEINVCIETKLNAEYLRPTENQVVIGSAKRLESELGWRAEIDLRDTIHDMVEFMEGVRE